MNIFFNLKKQPSDVVWSNAALVGDSSYPTYNGLPVVVAGLALSSFARYMNSKTFPFSYDQAIGYFA